VDLTADRASHGRALLQFRNHKLVYRRYAGLFFSFCVDSNDNELVWLEAIHLFVEVLGTSSPVLLSSQPPRFCRPPAAPQQALGR
jgi:hypothetical protein